MTDRHKDNFSPTTGLCARYLDRGCDLSSTFVICVVAIVYSCFYLVEYIFVCGSRVGISVNSCKIWCLLFSCVHLFVDVVLCESGFKSNEQSPMRNLNSHKYKLLHPLILYVWELLCESRNSRRSKNFVQRRMIYIGKVNCIDKSDSIKWQLAETFYLSHLHGKLPFTLTR